MKKYHFFVGVDISKNSLDICFLSAENPKETRHYTIANTPKAIVSYLKQIAANEVLFCMEDTGVYGMPLCQTLEKMNLDYAVVPAIDQTKQRATSWQER